MTLNLEIHGYVLYYKSYGVSGFEDKVEDHSVEKCIYC